MQDNIIPYSKFKSDMRDSVLKLLDTFAANVMETDRVKGWTDRELSILFIGVDAHAKALAERINAGHEVNSGFVCIDMSL